MPIGPKVLKYRYITITITMDRSNKYQEDLLAVLDLMYRKFHTEPAKKTEKGKFVISIYLEDLKHQDLHEYEFREIFNVFENKGIDFKLLNEIDDYTYNMAMGTNSIEEILFFEIELPGNFKALCEQLKDSIKKDNAGLPEVTISKKDGIFMNKTNNNSKYAIKVNSSRSKIIWALKDNPIMRGPDLAELFYKNNMPTLVKEIREINRNFIKNLNLEKGSKDLIIRNPTGGYSLNRDSYQVTFT